jgi:cytochrome P450
MQIFVVNDAESLRRVRAETCPTSSRPSFVFDSQDMSSCPNIVVRGAERTDMDVAHTRTQTIADETLRYQASSMSWRMCLKDTLLPCADGSVFHVRKGEMVCGIPYSWHHSAALWAQPHAFAPFDNFPAGRPRGDSYSSVSRSRGNSYSSMSRPRGNSLSSESGALLDGKAALQRFHPWGGGATICPGRRVAITHMRIFLATFFATFDVVDADAVPPGNWATKTGPGIVVPAREWCATLAKRA